MAIETDFIQYLDKPSGVYRLTKDKSQVNTIGSAPTIPLVIGFSKKGLFNTPVYCTDKEYFVNIFGDIDRTLERKGSWFHRTALELLDVSPIIVLNLYNLKNDVPSDYSITELTDPLYDITEYQSMSVGASYTNDPKRKDLLKHFYNTDKFWFPDGEKFNEYASLGNNDSLLHFVNLSQKPITIISRKSKALGFDVSLNEWYGLDNVPEYLNGYDYVSDYFMDVVVLSGDFTDYTKLSIDPIFGPYFDRTRGFKKERFNDFLSLNQVTVLDIYTGCLIPDFIDKTGQVLSLVSLINQNTSRTGLLASLNEDVLDSENVSGTKMDLIGHNAFYNVSQTNNKSVNFLSYKGDLQSTTGIGGLDPINFANYISFSNITGQPGKKLIKLTIPNTTSSSTFTNLYNRVNKKELNYNDIINVPLDFGTQGDAVFSLSVDTAVIVNNNAIITFKPFDIVDNGYMLSGFTIAYDATYTTFNQVGGITHTELLNSSYFSGTGAMTLALAPTTANSLGDIYDYAKSGIVAKGDKLNGVYITNGTSTHTFDLVVDNVVFLDSGNININFLTPNYATYNMSPNGVYVDMSQSNTITYINLGLTYLIQTNPYVSFDVVSNHGIELQSNEMIVSRVTYGYNNNNSLQLGKFILSEYGTTSRLTRITKIEKINGVGWKIIAEGPIYNYGEQIIYTNGIDDHFNHYNGTTLFGFRIKDRMIPNNSNDRMNEILNVLTDTNLFNTLIDKKAISFRYVVDTFNHGLETSSKSIISKLCKQRENAFGILNAPSIKEFRDSTDPLFADLPTTANPKPNFDMRYILQGGNLQNNPSFRYTLPSELDGSAYCAFYMPNVLVRERGKVINVPIAMYVAKNFILKHTNFRPWSIIAGNKRGVISGRNIVGIEYQIDDRERGYLEKFGINAVTIDKTDGLVITGNYTAKQNIKTSLSQINGIEVLIYIQDRVAEVLKKYIWEFNTPELRLEVKTIVDGELEQIKIDGGIYDYKNIMNSGNNTNETIDNLLGILDSHIEVAKGLAKAIHRTTIHKTGQIATGIL